MANDIKAVIFDQGGVLSRGGEKGTNEETATRLMGLGATIKVPDLLEVLKRGVIDNATFIAEVNRRYPEAPTKLTDKMWDEIYTLLEREPLAYDFARRCRESGHRVGLLSNISPGMAARLRAGGAYDGFDFVVLSCDAGCAKPDPEIYELVERQLPSLNPDEILLLDDQDKCIIGARRRGWQAIQVTSPEQMVKDASRLLGLS